MKNECIIGPAIKYATICFSFAFLLLLPSPSEIWAGGFEVSPFAGYNLFDSQQNLEGTFVFGGRVGFNLSPILSIESAGEFINTEVDDKASSKSGQGQFTSPIDNVDIILYHLDLLYHFKPESNFNPFISAGFGFANYDPKINDHDLAFMSFGLGTKYWLSDNFALRLELRDNMILNESLHNLSATLGVVFAFGGKKKSKRADSHENETEPDVKVDKSFVIIAPMVEPKVEKTTEIIAHKPPINEDHEIALSFEDVNFDFDKSTLTEEAQARLKRSVQLLKENPKTKIRIGGYTSAAGTEEYNQKLSERRAKAVYDYLTKKGLVSPQKLITIGYGEMRPAMHEPSPENIYSKEAKSNMRVLFEIIVK